MQKTFDFARFAWNTSKFVIPKANNENRIEDAFGLVDWARPKGPICGPSRVFPNENLPRHGRKEGRRSRAVLRGIARENARFFASNVRVIPYVLSMTIAR